MMTRTLNTGHGVGLPKKSSPLSQVPEKKKGEKARKLKGAVSRLSGSVY